MLIYSHAWSYSSSSYYLTAFPYNERKVDPRLPSHAQAKAETSAQENEKMVRITSSFISLEYCLFHLPTLAYLRTQSRKLKSANNKSQSLVKQVSLCTGHWIELFIYKWKLHNSQWDMLYTRFYARFLAVCILVVQLVTTIWTQVPVPPFPCYMLP